MPLITLEKLTWLSPIASYKSDFYLRQVGDNPSSRFSWELMLWLTKETSAKRFRAVDAWLDRNLAFKNAQTADILLQKLSN